MIVILGPTASGKTTLACHLALKVDAEIISADSRQVYRGMDIGSGKDLDDFEINGLSIPYHLIDIRDPGYEYNVFEFQEDFLKAYEDIKLRGKEPILCGGSGMYLEAALAKEKFQKVDPDPVLRSELNELSDDDLITRLQEFRSLHNTTDSIDRERIIRAIEIAKHESKHPKEDMPAIPTKVFGIKIDRKINREQITKRLRERLENGMIEEVEYLLKSGVRAEKLAFYGLEYRFLTQYVNNEISYNDMYQRLNSAIHQFAKRQMTWFRRMEKKGTEIQWINAELSLDDKLDLILNSLKKDL